ncbi:MAG TPA: hypothetical protein DEP72_02880 [Clostridiales bacterium]|nr:MAG: hypothetical protein A2Y18_07840 [Clostridiales bacterium GWD2_32_19]HCC07099.1 hypothetical protein [Clostridiales bacterium]
MTRFMKKPELLAPAGDMHSLKAAVNAGADSVYIGGKSYSARASANNFDICEISEALDYCLLRGVKLFVTVNTLYKETEVGEVIEYISKLYEMGVTALIIQDIGLAKIIKTHFPDIKLHASTQMTAHNLEDVKFLKAFGFDRIVLSRELSLKEIKNIKENSNMQIETFVHGALCISYSGQCLMSSMIGGRSGNRGRCAQPCRRRYEMGCNGDIIENKSKYILSLKDICTIDIIPELINAQIDSFKIEGRMKKPEYVAGVTSIYRKYLDNVQNVICDIQLGDKRSEKGSLDKGAGALATEGSRTGVVIKDKQTLAQLFNRGNFSDGYYMISKSRDMMSMESPKNQGLVIGEVIGYEEKNKDCIIKTIRDLAKGDGLNIIARNGTETSRTLACSVDANTTFKQYIETKTDIGSKVYRTYDAKLENKLKVFYEKDIKKHKVSMIAELKQNKKIKLTVYDEKHMVNVEGDIVEVANNNPLSSEKIKEQLSKTGNTPFEVENIELNIDDNIYINISKINELRREVISIFMDKILGEYRRKKVDTRFITLKSSYSIGVKGCNVKKEITVSVRSFEQYQAAIECEISRIYVDIFEMNDDILKMIGLAHEKGIEIFVALPHILREKNEKKVYKQIYEKLEKTDIDGYLIRTVGEHEITKESKKKKVIDYTLNLYNNQSIGFWLGQGVENVTISPELNIAEIGLLTENQEIVIYGKLPVMFIEQCIVKNLKGNIACTEQEEKYYLKDEMNVEFELEKNCNLCLNVLYNSEDIFLLPYTDKISRLNVKYYRINLKDEDYESTKKIIQMHTEILIDGIRTKGTDKYIEVMKKKGYTKGHYFRGVE